MIRQILAGFIYFWPLVMLFLSTSAVIFACKAFAQAKDNGQAIKELRGLLEGAVASSGTPLQDS